MSDFIGVYLFFGSIVICVTFIVIFARFAEHERRLRRFESAAPRVAERSMQRASSASSAGTAGDAFSTDAKPPAVEAQAVSPDVWWSSVPPSPVAESPQTQAVAEVPAPAEDASANDATATRAESFYEDSAAPEALAERLEASQAAASEPQGEPVREVVATSARPSAGQTAEAKTATAPPRAARPVARNWELFAGGRLLNVIGAIVLVIGVASLLKYAWDENWVSAPLRIAAGAIFGTVLLALGHVSHVRAKSKWFEHGLFGAGLGTLYASGYSAFAGYHIVPFGVAYGFMSFVTIVAFALSVRYESLPMAIIGWAGGFVTPFAVYDGGDNPIGLVSYVVLLDIGLLAVSLARRGWSGLQPLALAASYFTVFAWYAQHAADLVPAVSAVGLLSIWLVFLASGVAESFDEIASGVRAHSLLRRALVVVNALVFWTFEHQALQDDSGALFVVSLIAAASYAVCYALFAWRAPRALSERMQYHLGAAAMLLGATVTHFEHFGFVTMVVVEAAAVAAFALVRRRLGGDEATAREGYLTSLALLGSGILALSSMLDVFAPSAGAWDFGFASRDLLLAAVICGSIAIDRCSREAAGAPFVRTLLRALSLFALATLQSAHCSQFALVTCYAVDAVGLVLIDRALRRAGRSFAGSVETNVSSLLFLFASVMAFVSTPDALAASGSVWHLRPDHRDGALLAIIVCATALDRIARLSSFLAARIVLRILAILGVCVLEAAHVSHYGLVSWYALDALALVLLDRGLRAVGHSYAGALETMVSALLLLLASAVSFSFARGGFDYVGGMWNGAFDQRDGALLAFAFCAFVLDRTTRRRAGSVECGIAFRQLGLLAVLALDIAHASGAGFATAVALEGITVVVIDRLLAGIGRSYAPGWEPAIAAIAAGVLAWPFLVTSDAPFTFMGGIFAFGFGHTDLALAALALLALAVERAYRRRLDGAFAVALRAAVMATVLVGTSVHADGFRFAEAVALEGLILAVLGTRAMFRDLEVAGLGALVVASAAVLLTPASWHAHDIFRYAPFADARFYAILITAIVTFVAGDIYRRRSTLPLCFSRAARVAALGLGTFAFTVEIRDLFELAIAKAHNELQSQAVIDLIARLTDGEGLAISAVWIAASIAVIAMGIVFRIKEFRIAAIALFDLTILKAFFVDLSSLSTPYRIVSFMGLGLVLLGVSYLYQRLERGFFDRGTPLFDALSSEEIAA